MRSLSSLVLALFLLLPREADAQEIQRYRQWIEGTEAGGMELTVTKEPLRIHHREWTQLERLGIAVRQDMNLTTTKAPDGSLHLLWSVRLSEEPMVGEADWSPKEPDKLRLSVKGGMPAVLNVPPGTYLWPGDSEAALKEAARTGRPVRFTEFAPSTQQWARLELEPLGPEPLPGFPDTVRFHGQGQEGALAAELDVWISPKQGEVRQVAKMAGLTVLLQRTELPAPSAPVPGAGFFQRTLAQLPPHPFLPGCPRPSSDGMAQGGRSCPRTLSRPVWVTIGTGCGRRSPPAPRRSRSRP